MILSHPTRGIYFLIHVHNYTNIKGLDSGKLHHCQKRVQRPCLISAIAENKPHARHDSFGYNESRHDSYPQFPRSPPVTLGPWRPFGEDRQKRKTPALLESRSAKASSTDYACICT